MRQAKNPAAKAKAPKSTCPFNRSQVVGLCKRFLKPEAYTPARDVPVFYQLFKLYPSETFWRAYTLSFQLNAMLYFKTQAGRAQLGHDYEVFHMTLKPVEQIVLGDKVGEDVAVVTHKPASVAELFGS